MICKYYGCSGLTSLNIPNSVTSIGDGAFSDCSGLTSIKVETGNIKYDSRNNSNAVIETSTNCLIVGCMNTIIPESVTDIGGGAFRGCSGLTSIIIPNNVASIGYSAFSYCSGLADVYCLAEEVPSTPSNAFGNSPVSDATLHVPATSIDAYKAKEPWSSFGSIVPLTQDEIDGIEDIEHSPLNIDYSEVAIYNLAGQKMVNGKSSMVNAKYHRGLNIIRCSDGTTRKVMLK